MARESKVRPSLTSQECLIIAAALERDFKRRMEDGEHNNPLLLKLMGLKEYMISFQSEESKLEAMVQQRLAAMGIQQAPAQTIESPLDLTTESIINLEQSMQAMAKTNLSPISRTDLTEDEIYDMLSLRPDSKRTPEENNWILSNGLQIKMRRAGMAQSKPLNEGDL